jgi:hypothetical protein
MKKILLLTIITLLSSCSSVPKEKSILKTKPIAQCDYLPESARPIWISGNQQTRDYYTSVAEAKLTPQHWQEQQSQARQQATLKLAESIRISIHSRLTIQAKKQQTNHQTNINRNIEQITQSTVDISLTQVNELARWLDQKSCVYYVKLGIPVKVVEAHKQQITHQNRFQHLLNQYQQSQQTTLPVLERVNHLKQAQSLLQQIDFNQLKNNAGKAHYQRQLNQQNQQLTTQRQSQSTVIIAQTQQTTPPKLIKKILQPLTNQQPNLRIKTKTCQQLENCLNQAKQHGAEQLILVNIQQQTNAGSMGSTIGKLTLSAKKYQLKTGKPLASTASATGDVMVFGNVPLKWEKAIKKVYQRWDTTTLQGESP